MRNIGINKIYRVLNYGIVLSINFESQFCMVCADKYQTRMVDISKSRKINLMKNNTIAFFERKYGNIYI